MMGCECNVTTIVLGLVVGAVLMAVLITQARSTKASTTQTKSKNPKNATTEKELQKYTRAEVSKHNNESDAWIIVDGRVYDITEYDIHPGDSSIGFHGPQHPDSVWNVIAEYLIGDVVEVTEMEKILPSD